MKTDILCIGNASYDIYFPMDEYPEEDRKYTVEAFLEVCGGPASNAAYLLGKWGASCGFVGHVGDDFYGMRIDREFRDANVSTDLKEIRKEHHTPLSCVVTNKSTGSRTIINRRHTQTEVRLHTELLETAAPRYLLFDGHEHSASILSLKLFPQAVSILNAGSLRPATRDLAGRVTHLLCSESFARALVKMESTRTDEELHECARRLMKSNPRPGCITLGQRGLVFWEDDTVYHMPAFSAAAVDTTAAGDIFHGAFMYTLYTGGSFRDDLLTGSAAASLSVAISGGRPSIPTHIQVQAFIEK